MKIDGTVRGASIGKSLCDVMEQHFGNLERFSQGDEIVHVIVIEEGDSPLERHLAEITVRHQLGACTVKKELLDTVEAACEVPGRLEGRMRKAHDKFGKRRGHTTWGRPQLAKVS